MRPEEIERARQMFVRVFGPHYGAQLMAQLDEGDFNRRLMCRIAPEVWDLDSVDVKTKVLCAIAACTAAHQNVKYFVRAALHHGITRAQIEEVILLAGLESGFPAAGVAKRLADEGYIEHQQMMTELRARGAD